MPERVRVLIVDDDHEMGAFLRDELGNAGYAVHWEAEPAGAIAWLGRQSAQVLVTDLRLGRADGLDLVQRVAGTHPELPVIVITAFGSIETAIRAIKLGARDYLTKPFRIEQLVHALERSLSERRLEQEVTRLRGEVAGRYNFANIVGRGPAMHEVLELVRRLSASSANVLLTGPSGTGKELIARALHHNSPRREGPFVALNCAAVPAHLLESELFGHKRGAFTDAHADRKGLFAEADGGTLFLDEVADLPPALQPKLLRVLQEAEIRPLGSDKTLKVDVRVIAATNRDLAAGMKSGAFREDLYYRLNVVHVALPRLCDRPEDVLALAEHFLRRVSERAGRKVAGFTDRAVRALLEHSWPGNVRELENAVERAVALCAGEQIDLGDLPASVANPAPPDLLAGALARQYTLADLEREYILAVLAATGGNKSRAAKVLGLDRRTLYRKLEDYRLAEPGDSEREEDEP